MVCSFTRAAATEVIDRGVPVAGNMIGTLHSICYRGLEEPTIAEMKASEFNAAAEIPYSVTPHRVDVSEASEGVKGKMSGDVIMARYQSLRARMIPRQVWSEQVKAFAQHWEGWKKETGYLDFNDLISVARDNFYVAPGYPRVMFVDEAQDLNALQFSCIRKWGDQMDRLVLVGDDDQAIYGFTGADAGNLTDRGIPESNKIILNQSYRVPRAVLEHSDRWIKSVTKRQEKEYLPRDADGEIRHTVSTWKNPEGVIADIQRQLNDGKTIMILASCAYMLPPTLDLLRSSGLLFHNPYRVTNGSWNPIRFDDGSTLSRVITFLHGEWEPEWTNHQLFLWVNLIRAQGLLRHGAKAQIKKEAERMPHSPADYKKYFVAPDVPWRSFDPWSGISVEAMTWLSQNAAPAKNKGIKYIKNIVENRGKDDLYSKPRIIVGTIHSVKGGEADVIYLWPDLSRDAYDAWHGGGFLRDDVIRMMYVGITRARETLVIPEAVSGMAAPI